MDGRTAGDILAALEAEHPAADDLAPRLGQYVSALVGHGLVALD